MESKEEGITASHTKEKKKTLLPSKRKRLYPSTSCYLFLRLQGILGISSLVPCPLSLVPCPLSLVPCPLSLAGRGIRDKCFEGIPTRDTGYTHPSFPKSFSHCISYLNLLQGVTIIFFFQFLLLKSCRFFFSLQKKEKNTWKKKPRDMALLLFYILTGSGNKNKNSFTY